MQKLDETSLKAVELKAPGAFQEEAEALYSRVKTGELFSAFTEQVSRPMSRHEG